MFFLIGQPSNIFPIKQSLLVFHLLRSLSNFDLSNIFHILSTRTRSPSRMGQSSRWQGITLPVMSSSTTGRTCPCLSMTNSPWSNRKTMTSCGVTYVLRKTVIIHGCMPKRTPAVSVICGWRRNSLSRLKDSSIWKNSSIR